MSRVRCATCPPTPRASTATWSRSSASRAARPTTTAPRATCACPTTARQVRAQQPRVTCHSSRVTCHVSRSGGERDREHHHQHRVLLRLYRLRQPHRLRGGRGGCVPPGGAAGQQPEQQPALVRASTARSAPLWDWTIWR